LPCEHAHAPHLASHTGGPSEEAVEAHQKYQKARREVMTLEAQVTKVTLFLFLLFLFGFFFASTNNSKIVASNTQCEECK
jgi:hypothetical protein